MGNTEGRFFGNFPSNFRYQHNDSLLNEQEIRTSLPYHISQTMFVTQWRLVDRFVSTKFRHGLCCESESTIIGCCACFVVRLEEPVMNSDLLCAEMSTTICRANRIVRQAVLSCGRIELLRGRMACRYILQIVDCELN